MTKQIIAYKIRPREEFCSDFMVNEMLVKRAKTINPHAVK